MTTYEAYVAALVDPRVLLIAKVTCVVAVAGLITTLLHRASASLRHFIWAMSLAGAVAVVVVDRTVPRVDVSLRHATPLSQTVVQSTPVGAAAVNRPITSVAQPTVINDVAQRPTSSLVSLLTLQRVWLAGMVIILLRFALGHAGLAVLTQRARKLNTGEWNDSLAQALRESRMERRIQLVVSAEIGAPVTWGHESSVILIPEEALAWSEERRRVVLLHELAHIDRADYLVQIVATVVCALYWFHPMVWVAARRLRSEAERACDDRVIGAGTTGAEYAAHLLDVARGARALKLTGAVAIGMARHSTLEGRMLAIIDTATSRAPVSGQSRRVHLGMLSAVVLLVGAVRPVETRAEIVTSVNVERPRALVHADARVEPRVAKPAHEAFVKAPVLAPLPLQQSSDSSFTRSVSASPGGTLTVDLRPGGSVSVHGWDNNRVEVRARLGGRDWRDVRIEFRGEGNGATLRTYVDNDRRSMSTSIEFDVYVPRRYDVSLRSGGGSFAVEDVEGEFSGGTGGGSIQLSRLTGTANMTTGGGSIAVANSNLDGRVSTGGGHVEISNNRGNLRGESPTDVQHGNMITTAHAGDVGTHVRGMVSGAIAMGPNMTDTHYSSDSSHVTRGGGDIRIENAPHGAVATTGGGNIHVGSADGDVHATTGSGMIHVGPTRGSVHATTGNGDVDVEVLGTRENNQSVTVLTGAGRVVIEVPRGFRGTVDLETAYTENRESPKIVLPWNIRSETSPTWDRSQGTPRRYVRVNGSVGGGGDAVIRVRTVNGDIEIRQK